MLVSAMVEVRTLAETLVLTPHYGPVAGAEEKFTPEGGVSGSCLLF